MAGKKVWTYNPKLIKMALGSHAVTGYGDDTFIVITPNSEGTTKLVGADGEVNRAISPDDTYNIQLTLLQDTTSHNFLQNMFNQDIDVDAADAIFPVLIKDLKGTLVFSAEEAWVVNSAERTYAKGITARTWTIATGSTRLNE